MLSHDATTYIATRYVPCKQQPYAVLFTNAPPITVSVVTSSIVGIISVSMIILVVVGTCVILVCKKRNNSLNEDNHEYENINLSHVAKPLPLELPPSNVDIITKKNSAYGKVKLNKSRLDNEENKAELNDGYELVSLTELDSENQVPTN